MDLFTFVRFSTVCVTNLEAPPTRMESLFGRGESPLPSRSKRDVL